MASPIHETDDQFTTNSSNRTHSVCNSRIYKREHYVESMFACGHFDIDRVHPEQRTLRTKTRALMHRSKIFSFTFRQNCSCIDNGQCNQVLRVGVSYQCWNNQDASFTFQTGLTSIDLPRRQRINRQRMFPQNPMMKTKNVPEEKTISIFNADRRLLVTNVIEPPGPALLWIDPLNEVEICDR